MNSRDPLITFHNSIAHGMTHAIGEHFKKPTLMIGASDSLPLCTGEGLGLGVPVGLTKLDAACVSP